jgi:hypothetical protein
MNIKFNGDGADFIGNRFDAATIHADGAGGSDYTLCGLTLDNDPGTCGTWTTTKKRITCDQCIQIIRHCKSIRL